MNNKKKKYARILSFMLVFVMFISSISFGTSEVPVEATSSEENALQADADYIAKALNDRLSLEKLTWDDGSGTKQVLNVATLGQIDQAGIKFVDNGSGKYNLTYTKGNVQYDCEILMYMGEECLNSPGSIYNFENNEPMIPINGTPDSDGNISIAPYVDKQIEMRVVIKDINGKPIVTGSNTKTIDKVKERDLDSGSPIVDAIKKVGGVIFAPVTYALKLLERIFTRIILGICDGILASVSAAVGEKVTIDGVILGDIKKVSIDFWQDEDGVGYMGSVLKDVVNHWYSVFRVIAVMVYMMLLLIIGIQILFSSTGRAKAKYKDLLKDWVIGITMLFLFPYAMKLLVNINDILVAYVSEANQAVLERTTSIEVKDDESIASSFGTDDFINQVANGTEAVNQNNTMLYIRNLAKQQGRIPLAIVYGIMLFQLIVILCMYYKRAFMVAFLIIIFPLVAMTYTIDKMTNGLAHTGAFNKWFKEYFVNVFVQLFHAITYVVIVNAGVKAYLSPSSNWFFMVLCVSFLFQGEKILRKIFGIESSAGTLNDLSKSAATSYVLAKRFFSGKDKKKKDPLREREGDDWSEEEQAEDEEEESTTTVAPRAPTTVGATTATMAAATASTSGAMTPKNVTKAQAVVTSAANKKRNSLPKRMLTGAAGYIGGGLGAVMGSTFGLASGDVSKAVMYGVGGWKAGKTIGRATTVPIKGISNVYAGHKMKKAVMRGELDDEFKKVGLDLNSMEAKTANLIRQALAEQSSAATSRGEKVGEYRFWKSIEKNK